MLRINADVKDNNLVTIKGDQVVNANSQDDALGVFHRTETKIKFITINLIGEKITSEFVLPAGIRQFGFDQINVAKKENPL